VLAQLRGVAPGLPRGTVEVGGAGHPLYFTLRSRNVDEDAGIVDGGVL
jgi:hypothetical protein